MFIKTIDGEYWNLSQAQGIATTERGDLLLVYHKKNVLIQSFATKKEAEAALNAIMRCVGTTEVFDVERWLEDWIEKYCSEEKELTVENGQLEI